MSGAAPSDGHTVVATALGARWRLCELLVGADTWELVAGAVTAGWFPVLGSATTAGALAAEHGLPVDQRRRRAGRADWRRGGDPPRRRHLLARPGSHRDARRPVGRRAGRRHDRARPGVSADGRREVLGFDVGASEDGAFWTQFLRSLKTRGLHVALVISDAHAGQKAAIGSVLLGSAWQRCRVPFSRILLAQVPQGVPPRV